MHNKEITIRDFETTMSKLDDVKEPIVVKRDNKKDLVVISLEEYQKIIFFKKLEKSKQDYKNGKFKDAKEVFAKLEEKYGY